MSIRTYAVNCNDAWLNTEGDDITASYVKYRDHQEMVAALEAKCAALAAENSALKSAIQNHSESIHFCELCGKDDPCSTDDVCMVLNETPATDAFLAEVRAQGVEMALRTAPQLPQPGEPGEPVKRVNSDQMRRVCLEATRHLDKYGTMAKEVNKLLGRAAMLQGAEPVQGWIPCSERMPDETQPVIVVSDGGVVQRTVYQFCEGVWIDWYEQHDEVSADAFTHWMPLPAAPQQEAKS